MIDVSKISKNLIAVSLISTVLVIWLSSQYWKDVHTQFAGATQLQLSVIPESMLFEISNSLDQERATIQRTLAGSDQFFSEREQLSVLKKNRQALFKHVRQAIAESRSVDSNSMQERYGDKSIDSLFSELDDKLNRIAVTRFVIMSQTFRAPAMRDEDIRMQLFDTYVNLNSAFNRLRKMTRTYPEKNNADVIAAHEFKDAIWSINESINQTSTLIESFLMKYQSAGVDAINLEGLALRTLQQHENTANATAHLSDIVKGNTITSNSSEAVLKFKEQYENIFRPEAKQLILSTSKITNLEEKLIQWQSISESTKQSVVALQEAVLNKTLATAESIKYKATINLLLNTLLVSLCMIMAYATFRIARNIQHQANHDELTGLPNRRYFNEELVTLFKNTDPTKNEKLILVTIDLNGFKSINDTKGHIAGDSLLIQFSDRLSSSVDNDTVIARMGGDEFAAAYKTNIDDDPYRFACKLGRLFNEAFTIDDGLVQVDGSIGYSAYPKDASNLNELQITSDFAMFSAKQAGRKTIQAYDRELANKLEYRKAIERDLLVAIENNELELFYQPQVNLKTNTANAVEALIRWVHPTRGMVSPDEFIGVAEDTGLMPAVGNWVLNEACRQIAQWNNTENIPIRVAVNVSVHEIAQPEFVQGVFDTMAHHGISADSLELEITESVVMTDINWVIKSLSALKDHGIRIALDDFGTGYSSLSQLQSLPLDTLKIDRSFIDKLDIESSDLKSVTATIASIAQIFNLETVAEGIETESQLREVKKLGIDVAQGYYYSKPVSKDDVISTIDKINRWKDDHRLTA